MTKKILFGIDLPEKINIAYYIQNKGRTAPSIPVERHKSVPNPVVQIVPRQIKLITVLCH